MQWCQLTCNVLGIELIYTCFKQTSLDLGWLSLATICMIIHSLSNKSGASMAELFKFGNSPLNAETAEFNGAEYAENKTAKMSECRVYVVKCKRALAKLNADKCHFARMVVSVNKVLANSKARGTPFQAKREVEYGLKVVSRNANGVVDSVQCQICRFHGRDRFLVPNTSVPKTSNSLHHLTEQKTIKSITKRPTRASGPSTSQSRSKTRECSSTSGRSSSTRCSTFSTMRAPH